MRIRGFRGVIAALVGAAVLFAAPVAAQCTLTGGVEDVEVSLIDQPFPYTQYRPQLTAAQIADLPALPEYDDERDRREHAYVSTALAAQLGIAPHDPAGARTVDPDHRGANPQIRVIIENPATFSNFDRRRNGVNLFEDRVSSAVFTVVGVIDETADRIWVYEQEDSTDNDSGEYKLFAADGATSGGSRIVRVQEQDDLDADGVLDTVEARVYAVPVSHSVAEDTFTFVTATSNPFCEPDPEGGSLTESSIRTGDPEVAILIPHGGAIETGTSDQIAPFVAVLDTEFGLDANVWDVQGDWGHNQTPKRWHITATTTDPASWPALAELLLQSQDFDADGEFQHAVAFHGFSGSALDVIVGGDAPRPVKCLIVEEVQDAVEALAGYDGDEIAFVIHDQPEGLIDVEDGAGRTVTRRDLEGTSDENIVNRLSADGGVQIEQSKALRDDATLRTAVAQAVARALGTAVTSGAAANACDQFLTTTP